MKQADDGASKIGSGGPWATVRHVPIRVSSLPTWWIYVFIPLLAALAGAAPTTFGVSLLGVAALVAALVAGPRRAAGPLVFVFLLMPDVLPTITIRSAQLESRTLVFFVIALMILAWAATGQLSITRPRGLWWWAIWWVACLGGAITAGSLNGLVLFGVYFFLPYLIGGALGDGVRLDRFLIWVGSAGLVLGGLALYEYATKHYLVAVDTSLLAGYERLDGVRARVTWGNPLTLGMILALTFFLSVEVCRGRLIRVAGLVVMVGGLLGTISRSPLLGLAAGAVSWVVISPGLRRRFQSVLMIGAAVLFLLNAPGATPDKYRNYLAESTQASAEASGNVLGRVRLSQTAAVVVRRKPAFGFGFGTTTNGKANFVSAGMGTFTDVPNWPVAVALETGLVGLLAMLGVVLSSLVRIRRSRSRYRTAVIAGVVAAFVTSFGVPVLDVGAPFFLVLGLFAGQVKGPDEACDESTGQELAATRAASHPAGEALITAGEAPPGSIS